MSLLALVDELAKRGVHLRATVDGVELEGPVGALSGALVEAVDLNGELLAWFASGDRSHRRLLARWAERDRHLLAPCDTCGATISVDSTAQIPDTCPLTAGCPGANRPLPAYTDPRST